MTKMAEMMTVEVKLGEYLMASFQARMKERRLFRRVYYVRRMGELQWVDYVVIWGLSTPRCTKVARKVLARMRRQPTKEEK